MLSNILPIRINSNDFDLAVKTMLEEIITYYRILPVTDSNYSQNIAFLGLEVVDFAGLNYIYSNYQELKKTKPNLEHLIGFSIKVPTDFDKSCNNNIELTLAVRSQYCTDVILKQNKIFDILRYTLTQKDFYFESNIATDILPNNLSNTNQTKYRLNFFTETNQNQWIRSQSDDQNYINSIQKYNFKIIKQ